MNKNNKTANSELKRSGNPALAGQLKADSQPLILKYKAKKAKD